MGVSDPCIMSQEAILAVENCGVPFTKLSEIATGTSFTSTLNQLDQDLKTICNNNDCVRAVSTYLDMCSVSWNV